MQFDNTYFQNLDFETLIQIIDNMYDEVLIYDGSYNIVYINQACRRHYAEPPEYMIGKSFFDLEHDWWGPSILPWVYEEKKARAIRQKTYTGKELLTIAVPLLDNDQNVKYVVMNVRDEINENDLHNPHYISSDISFDSIDQLVAKSDEMKHVLSLIKKISRIDATSIITGESGTGKSMLAKYMHSVSPRKNKSFVKVNCASIPRDLFESEFFGYVRGAFTGAKSTGKKGLLELANEGTLFLDEISELSLLAQAKLLTVIQDKEFMPVGATKPVVVDVKIVVATNRDLKTMVSNNKFREDLYYRLNVFEVYIPPLRRRKKDILHLLDYFVNEYNNKYNLTRQLSNSVIQILLEHEWKGNVRELSHMIERLIVTVDSMVIDANHLPSNVFDLTEDDCDLNLELSFDDRVDKYQAYIIRKAYGKFDSSRKLADHLGVTQTRAYKLIKKYIEDPE